MLVCVCEKRVYLVCAYSTAFNRRSTSQHSVGEPRSATSPLLAMLFLHNSFTVANSLLLFNVTQNDNLHFSVWNDVLGFDVLNVEPNFSSRTSVPKFSLWSMLYGAYLPRGFVVDQISNDSFWLDLVCFSLAIDSIAVTTTQQHWSDKLPYPMMIILFIFVEMMTMHGRTPSVSSCTFLSGIRCRQWCVAHTTNGVLVTPTGPTRQHGTITLSTIRMTAE